MSNHLSDEEYRTRVDEICRCPAMVPPKWCAACGIEVRMIPAEAAAAAYDCGRLLIYRWIEDGDLHFAEADDGEVYLCERSLLRQLESLDPASPVVSEKYFQ